MELTQSHERIPQLDRPVHALSTFAFYLIVVIGRVYGAGADFVEETSVVIHVACSFQLDGDDLRLQRSCQRKTLECPLVQRKDNGDYLQL